MVRELADYDVERMPRVFRWPLREALIAYEHRTVEAAKVEFRHRMLVWACVAPHSSKRIHPPQPPPILKERD
jgi:hypothetical protein